MSTILDALRRLESDRQRRDAAERSHHGVLGGDSGLGAPSRRAAPWVFGGLVGLAVVAIAAVFVGLRGGPDDAALEMPPSVAAAAQPVAPESAALPGLPPVVPPAPTAVPSASRTAPPPVGILPRPSGAPSPVGSPVRPAAQPPRAPDAPVRPVAVLPAASAAPIPPAPVAPGVESRAVDSPRSATAPPSSRRRTVTSPDSGVDRAAAGVRKPAAARQPPIGDAADADEDRSGGVAVSVARGVEVSIVRTIWHPFPERRIAHLRFAGTSANREVHEGDVVDGYEVSEIKPTGVLFVRDGVTVERRVAPKR